MAKRGRGRKRRSKRLTPYQKFLKLCGMSGHAKRSRFASLKRRGKIRFNPDYDMTPTLGGFRTMGAEEAHAYATSHRRGVGSKLHAIRSGPTTPLSGAWAMRGPIAVGHHKRKRASSPGQGVRGGAKAWFKKVQRVNAAINKLNLKLIAKGVSDSERRDTLEKERRKLMAKKRKSKRHGKARGRGGRRRRRISRRCRSAARRLGRCRKKGALRVRGRRIKSRKRYCSRAGKAMARFCRRKRRAKKNMWLSNPLIEMQDLKVEGMAALKSLPATAIGLGLGLALPALVLKDETSSTTAKLSSLAVSALGGALAAVALKACPDVGGLGLCGGRQHAVAAALGGVLAIVIKGAKLLLGQDVVAQASAGKMPGLQTASAKGLGYWPNQLLASNMSDFMNPTTGFDASDQLMLDQADTGGFVDNSFMSDSPLHNSFSLADQFGPSAFSLSDQFSPDQILGGS